MYKILDMSTPVPQPTLPWIPLDIQDGFMHCSTALTLPFVLRKFYSGQDSVIIVKIQKDRIPKHILKWEPATLFGKTYLFPHTYEKLNWNDVVVDWKIVERERKDGAFTIEERWCEM